MSLPYKTEDNCEVSIWDDRCFAGEDEDGDEFAFDRDEGRLTVESDGAYLPVPELVSWLNGQDSPPEPPISVGDTVTWGVGAVNYTVVAMDGGKTWLRSMDGLHDTLYEPASALRRVPS